MINIKKSVSKLKEMCVHKGGCFQEYKGNIEVHTPHGIFYIKVFPSHIDIKPYVQEYVDPKDYWVYFDWVVVE